MRVRNSGNNKNQSNIIIGIGSPVPQVHEYSNFLFRSFLMVSRYHKVIFQLLQILKHKSSNQM